jgi:UDP-N-acetylmuramate dehydrogenase
MQPIINFSLKNHNTFGIDAYASQYISIKSEDQLIAILKEKNTSDVFILGGGSNMLLTKDIDELVLHINIRGVKIIKEEEDFVWIEAKAGENWHELVLYAIDNDFGGFENMSLIPGNVGTTPIQNIGAYGTEIKDTLIHCDAIEIKTGKKVRFTNSDCSFGYRDSIFKKAEKGNYVITAVTFQLSKKNHKINIAYGDIKKELEELGIKNPNIKQVSDAVTSIRKSKLPDPKELGNCGSFFKNPIIPLIQFQLIHKEFPEMPSYPVSDDLIKVPAGWLIENAGFKGKRFGDAGVHQNQALVIVNYGLATGNELLQLSKKIQETVFKKFKITIEAEVNIL